MNAKYSYPYCVRPLYYLETEEQAGNCGKTTGFIYALVFSFVVGLLGFRFLYYKEKDSQRKRYIVMGIIGVIISGLILISLYFKYGYKVAFKGYADIKTKMEREGIDKYKTIEFIQGLDAGSYPNYTGIYSAQTLATVLMASKKDVSSRIARPNGEEKKEKKE
jgi:hypothetical protein